MFAVTINPHTPVGLYYGPHLLSDGDWYEITDRYLVIFAGQDPEVARDLEHSILIIPLEDLLALDELPSPRS